MLTADTYTAVLETEDIFKTVLIIGVYYMLSEIVSHTLQTMPPDTLSLYLCTPQSSTRNLHTLQLQFDFVSASFEDLSLPKET